MGVLEQQHYIDGNVKYGVRKAHGGSVSRKSLQKCKSPWALKGRECQHECTSCIYICASTYVNFMPLLQLSKKPSILAAAKNIVIMSPSTSC